MPLLALPFPAIDPIAVQIGPLAIRWYALAYLAGFLLGWRYCLRLADHMPKNVARTPTRQDYDDFLTWAVVGVILGGRSGYVFFYNFSFYLENPLSALMMWHGGMSFHGGLAGVVVATLLFCRQRKLSPFMFGDALACAAPIGLFFGRIANFVNGELWGRVSEVSWAVVFPRGGFLPRHPSQLYEAALEGAVLFLVLFVVAHRGTIAGKPLWERPGTLSGVFFIGYGLSRLAVEFFREPDPQLGFLFAGATMGQLLSAPMLMLGVWFLWRGRRE
ncbi:Phosphatidylglycerol--prolipoprotein diacylglyceryl transferase [Azospirillaceae bacterium]